MFLLSFTLKPTWGESFHEKEPGDSLHSGAAPVREESKSPDVPEMQFSPLKETKSTRVREVDKSTADHVCGTPLPAGEKPAEDTVTLFFKTLNSRFFAVNEERQEEMLELLEQESVQSDRPLKRSRDIENNLMVIDYDYYYRSYKDGRNVYNALPILIRIDTGPGTEARIQTDSLTWQDPNCGFNDLNVGFKWHFAEKNSSMAFVGFCELPTAGGGVGDPGVEPSAAIAIDTKLGERWDWLVNIGAVNNVDGNSFQRYWQWIYASEFDYSINKKSTVSLALIATCPNAFPDGTNLTRLDLGYSYNPRPDI